MNRLFLSFFLLRTHGHECAIASVPPKIRAVRPGEGVIDCFPQTLPSKLVKVTLLATVFVVDFVVLVVVVFVVVLVVVVLLLLLELTTQQNRTAKLRPLNACDARWSRSKSSDQADDVELLPALVDFD